MKLSDGKNKFAICMNCKASSNAAERVEDVKYLWNKRAEQTAKVEIVEKPNVFKCGECGQYFHSTAWGSPVEYCSRCGCRLDWNEDIPMEYFESGGR